MTGNAGGNSCLFGSIFDCIEADDTPATNGSGRQKASRRASPQDTRTAQASAARVFAWRNGIGVRVADETGAFSEVSDVDLGIEREPAGMTVYQLISLLGERLGRRADVVLLPDCRFKERIVREGETWMPQD